MAQWFELGLEMQNAVALANTWGLGPVRSGAEALAFAKALQAAKLSVADQCLLLAWLGGAAEQSSQGAIHALHSQLFNAGVPQDASAAAACRVPTDNKAVAAALTRLHKAAPMLGTVLYMKASAKAQLRAEQNGSNPPKLVKDAWKAFRALRNDAAATEKKVAVELLSTAGAAFNQAVSTAKAGAEALVNAADVPSLLPQLPRFEIPWWLWVAGGVAVVGGVAVATAPLWKPLLLARAAARVVGAT